MKPNGMSTTPNPSRIWVVDSDSAPRITSLHGDADRPSRKWCSTTQTVLKPSLSAYWISAIPSSYVRSSASRCPYGCGFAHGLIFGWNSYSRSSFTWPPGFGSDADPGAYHLEGRRHNARLPTGTRGCGAYPADAGRASLDAVVSRRSHVTSTIAATGAPHARVVSCRLAF